MYMYRPAEQLQGVDQQIIRGGAVLPSVAEDVGHALDLSDAVLEQKVAVGVKSLKQASGGSPA